MEELTIAEIAAGNPDFSILVTALDAAGLVDAVADPDADLTVFAPNNAAFAALAQDLGYTGDTDDNDAVFGFIADALAGLDPNGDPIPLLTEILLYHVSPTTQLEADVLAADTIATLQSDGATISPADDGRLVDNEPDLFDPSIAAPDIMASNGVIQGIDRVLLPIDVPGNDKPTIADVATGSPDFSILVTALETADLVGVVADPDQELTVFAPTNEAFAALATDLGFTGDTSDTDAVFGFIADTLASLDPNGDPVPLLTEILLYHVSPGFQTTAQVRSADTVATLATGGPVITPADDGRLVDLEPDLLDPSITSGDFDLSNGTIQVVDRVLIPADFAEIDNPTIAEIAAGSDNFSILVTALETAGLVDVVADPDAEFTVFAPTNNAFATLATDLGFEGDTSDTDAVFGFIADTLASLDPNGDPVPLLTDILLYHVSPGAKSLEQINAADQVATALDGAFVVGTETGLLDVDPDRPNAEVVTALTDVGASNGTIQGIDRVLLPLNLDDPEPTQTIADIVAASGDFDDNGADFDILLAALQATDLVDAFTNPDDSLTVFAPTDDAFLGVAALFGSTAEDEDEAFDDIAEALAGFTADGNPIPLLADILTYHVVPGELSRAELAASPELVTLNGATVVPDGATIEDGATGLPDPAFIDAASDITASNGIIQAIDGVLIFDDLPGVGDFTGTDGDDVIPIGPATLSVDGGEGSDTVVFDNALAATTLAPIAGGFAATTGDTTIDIVNVDTFQFDDATLVADTGEPAAQAFRLYGAAFGRDADLPGITFWTDAIEAAGLAPVADEFVSSDEFAERFGDDTTGEGFVNALYNEVLGRDADDDGLAFWTGELADDDFDDSDLLVAFSESSEYKEVTANETDDGVLLLG